MNFFECQEQAKKKTFRLVVLYLLAVILTFCAIHSLVAAIYVATLQNGENSAYNGAGGYPLFWRAWFRPDILATDFFIVMAVIGCGTLFKIFQLKETGGDGVAISFGGTLIHSANATPKEKRLLNIVEEMAIASGIHVPNVYVLKNEAGINAFAAGFTPATSVVAVTQGALDYLTRDELQGVIGHEFSHILHHDTNLNLKLIGVLFGLEMIAMIGFIIMRSAPRVVIVSDNRDRNGGVMAAILATILLGFGLFLIGLVGQLFANLIRAAISRQREFLADASSVQFTRNPSGIANALKKIGCPSIGSKVDSNRAAEASHMFFGNVFSPGFFAHLFDSHPDLTARIQRIEPSFNGDYSNTIQKLSDYDIPPAEVKSQTSSAEILNRLPIGQTINGTGNLSGTAPAALAASILEGIGEISEKKLTIAETLLEKIPDTIAETVRDSDGAVAAVMAILLDRNSEVREGEITLLKKNVESSVMEKIYALEKELVGHSDSVKIPIVQIAFPALKTLSKPRYLAFRKTVDALMKFDGRIDILEFAIAGFIVRDLDQFFGLAAPISEKYNQITSILSPFYVVVSFLAYAGNDRPEEQEKAFYAATSFFYLESTILPKEECSPVAFVNAMKTLTQASYVLRHKILTALYRCVAADGFITEREGEFIRAITAHFQCPMPTWGEEERTAGSR